MYKFNAEHATSACIKWIQNFFEENGEPICQQCCDCEEA